MVCLVWHLAIALCAFEPRQDLNSDKLCGVRCASFVIRRLTAIETDLLDLSDEMGVDLANSKKHEASGTSMKSIQDAFESRGLHTRLVRLRPWQQICEPFAVVVHVNLPNGEGHYVVQEWVDGQVVIWDGEVGYCEEIPFAGVPTGNVIVVSADPLPRTVVCRHPLYLHCILPLVAVVIFGAVVAKLVCRRKVR
jgi:hypothetical protein